MRDVYDVYLIQRGLVTGQCFLSSHRVGGPIRLEDSFPIVDRRFSHRFDSTIGGSRGSRRSRRSFIRMGVGVGSTAVTTCLAPTLLRPFRNKLQAAAVATL